MEITMAFDESLTRSERDPTPCLEIKRQCVSVCVCVYGGLNSV